MFSKYTLPLMLALLLVTGCSKAAPEAGVVATVNGQAITETDLEHFIQLQRAQNVPLPPDPLQARQQALNELIDRAVLMQKALDDKLQDNPDVKAALKTAHDNILVNAEVQKLVQGVSVTDADAKKLYDQQVAKISTREYKARHILVKTRAEAEAIIKQLEKGASFAKLAKEKSLDVESAKNGGELGWIRQDMVVPSFFDALTKLKKGQFTKTPVQSQYGWHVIQLEDVRPWKAPPFEAVKNNFLRAAQSQKLEAVIQDLRAKAKVEITKP